MPEENAASDLVERAGGHVGRPEATSLPAAAAWVDALLADDERRDTVRAQARELAEQEFSLAGCADRFEAVLERGAR
jgi:glycosyltransferase involved in cell wall biosynthesis